tara:strand:+ start:291 stop:749 length:459 start_codon:yes stop_codon:yes gene_type:complete
MGYTAVVQRRVLLVRHPCDNRYKRWIWHKSSMIADIGICGQGTLPNEAIVTEAFTRAQTGSIYARVTWHGAVSKNGRALRRISFEAWWHTRPTLIADNLCLPRFSEVNITLILQDALSMLAIKNEWTRILAHFSRPHVIANAGGRGQAVFLA